MILRRLRIRRFKKFQDTTFAFVPGLNIIQGPNESGKTTVMEALFAALLVNPAQPQAGFADLTRPWGEQRLGELVLEFQVDDGSYLLRKDFEAGTALLQPQERKGAVDNLRDIQQQILDWMGLPSEAAVRSTAYVGQGELARLTDDRHLIGARLSKILSGGGAENVDAALRWIDERSQHPEPAAGKPSGAGDGRLQELVSQQQELERKEERARTLWSELRAATRQLEELERQIAMRTEQLQAAEQQAVLQRRLEDLEKELREHQDLLNRLEKHLNRLNSLETRLKSFTDQNQAALQALVTARRTAQNLGHALQTGRQQLEREEATLEQLGSGHQHARRRAGAGLVVSLLGAMAITLGFVLPQLRWSVPGWGTIAAGALLMVLGVQMRGRVGETQALYRRQEQRVLDLRKKVEAAHAQMEEAEKELRAKLASLGAESVEAVEQRFASYMDVARQQEEARLAVQQLLGGRTREKVVERMQEVEREVAEVRGRLHDVTASARATEATRDRLQRESQALQKEAAALGERKARIEGMLEGLLDRPEGTGVHRGAYRGAATTSGACRGDGGGAGLHAADARGGAQAVVLPGAGAAGTARRGVPQGGDAQRLPEGSAGRADVDAAGLGGSGPRLEGAGRPQPGHGRSAVSRAAAGSARGDLPGTHPAALPRRAFRVLRPAAGEGRPQPAGDRRPGAAGLPLHLLAARGSPRRPGHHSFGGISGRTRRAAIAAGGRALRRQISL